MQLMTFLLNWVNQSISSSAKVSSGVVKGGVLGPMLFALYINDLPDSCKDVTVKLYADDVKLNKVVKCPADRLILQSSINAFVKWFK